jgi:hypothetical protein
MKTRKHTKKMEPKLQEKNITSMPKGTRIAQGEFEAEEALAQKHFSIDEEWKPKRKSKGADEEG